MNMRKQIWIYILALSLALLFACSSNSSSPNEDNDPDNIGNGTMTLKVDGVGWEPARVIASQIHQTLWTITADDSSIGSFRAIIFVIQDVNGVSAKSYSAIDNSSEEDSGFICGYFEWFNNIEASTDGNNPQGTLTIIEINEEDNYISGRFSAEVLTDETPPRLIRITEGEFTGVPINQVN